METKYFIYAHEAAFNACRHDGLVWSDGALRTGEGVHVAILSTPVLDSNENGNVWQRVKADMEIMGGGRIVWRLYASDVEYALDHVTEAFTIENADDFLPIEVRGRYMRLEAMICGGVSIRSLAVFQGWESFLDYLPEIYRDYNSFTDRFLRIFMAQYLDLERQISEFPGTLDPLIAPPETLRYLAELVGVRHINLWETDGLRRLLSSGIYCRHGQFSVFSDYIEYFTGFKPCVAEHFRYQNGVTENDVMYTDADITVFMPPEAAGINMEALNVAIDDFLPADVVCRVIILDPHPVMSGGAILGVNTRIGKYEQTMVGTARVGVTLIGGDL